MNDVVKLLEQVQLALQQMVRSSSRRNRSLDVGNSVSNHNHSAAQSALYALEHEEDQKEEGMEPGAHRE